MNSSRDLLDFSIPKQLIAIVDDDDGRMHAGVEESGLEPRSSSMG